MVRIVIIGGSGHVGTYLVPSLVERGHEVINVSRGNARPYKSHAAWEKVTQVIVDRKAEEKNGTFGSRIAGLKPDIVIDMISFELAQVEQLVTALAGEIEHYIFCSTIWVYGHSTVVPASEVDASEAIEPYGTKKAQIEAFLMQRARKNCFPATSFRPGHIVGEGWNPVNPLGNLNPDVFARIARGAQLALPDHGLATLHHVHADDCARWVLCAIDHREATIGECFNVVSPQAVTLRGYAEAMYRWFGHEPRLSFQPYDQWKLALPKVEVDASWSHISHSPCASIEKSQQRIGYHPRYSSLESIQQSVTALIESGTITVPATSS